MIDVFIEHLTTKKRGELNHLNCITKLNDYILNYLFENDTNM